MNPFKFFKKDPMAPARKQRPEVPASMPQLQSGEDCSGLLNKANPSPAAADALQSQVATEAQGATPFFQQLVNDPRFSIITLKCLAHGLKPERAIQWAAEAGMFAYSKQSELEKGAVEMSPAEEKALEAAKTYATDPSSGAKDAVTTAVADEARDHARPGSWAAQAAQWHAEPLPLPPDQARDLVPHAVIGSLLFSAHLIAPSLEAPEVPQLPEQPGNPVATAAEEAAKALAQDALKAEAQLPEPPQLPEKHDLLEQAEGAPLAEALQPILQMGFEIAALPVDGVSAPATIQS